MKPLVSIVLAAAIALTGVPHVFCACGCGGSSELEQIDARAPVCPFCGNHRPDQTPDDCPAPCKCGSCDIIDAIVTGRTTPISLMAAVGCVGLEHLPSLSEPAQASTPGVRSGVELPAHLAGLHCALVIFLGHLLL